jgi:hypothetical protein
MPMRPKVVQLDTLVKEIVDEDAKRRTRSKRTIPVEVVEAMDYYVAWGLARNRAEALVRLAQPLSIEVIAKVRSLDLREAKRNVRSRGGRGDS